MKDEIAIDFGTMRTKLAYRDSRRGTVELMRLGLDERPFIPSLFFLAEDGRRLFGDDAAEYLDSDPLSFLAKPLKRSLREQWVRAGNREKATPVELLSLLFSGLRNRTREIAGFHETAPTGIALTVPVRYGPPDKEVLKDAALRAGFHEERIRFVDEPVAAAQAWLTELGGTEDYIVVLDCGGGTMDWACLHRSEGGRFELTPEFPPDGDNRIGGFDVDEAIYAEVDDRIADEAGRLDLEVRSSAIKNEIRLLKERHSRTGAGGRIKIGGEVYEIDSDRLEDIIDRRFTTQACQSVSSYLDKVRGHLNIDRPTVLLVGGSARLKGFKDALEEQGSCKAVWWERSEYATVLGALGNDTPKPSVKSAPVESPAKQTEYLEQVSAELALLSKFVTAVPLLYWRLSSGLAITSGAVREALAGAGPQESPAAMNAKIEDAVSSIRLRPFDDELAAFVATVRDSIEDAVTGMLEPYLSRYPDLASTVESVELGEGWDEAGLKQVTDGTRTLRGEYSDLEAIAAAIQEQFTRYQRILRARQANIFTKIITELGLEGMSGAGGAYADLSYKWWKDMDDDGFFGSYKAAVSAFPDKCMALSDQIETKLTAATALMKEPHQKISVALLGILSRLAEQGVDVKSLAEEIEREVAERDWRDPMSHYVASDAIFLIRSHKLATTEEISGIVKLLQRAGALIDDKGSVSDCPRGHGPLKEWCGTLRCWECGWPFK